MKNSTFIAIVLGTIGGLLFSLGMCMCLIPEWQLFTQGIIIGSIGGVFLLATLIVWRMLEGKNVTRPKANPKTIGRVLLGTFGVLLFGLGMSFALVWESMIIGVIIGIVGIVVMLFMIPLKSEQKDNINVVDV